MVNLLSYGKYFFKDPSRVRMYQGITRALAKRPGRYNRDADLLSRNFPDNDNTTDQRLV